MNMIFCFRCQAPMTVSETPDRKKFKPGQLERNLKIEWCGTYTCCICPQSYKIRRRNY